MQPIPVHMKSMDEDFLLNDWWSSTDPKENCPSYKDYYYQALDSDQSIHLQNHFKDLI